MSHESLRRVGGIFAQAAGIREDTGAVPIWWVYRRSEGCWSGEVDGHLRHERRKREDTTDGSNIKTKQHTSETSGACHHERTPSVDLGRILLHGLILDDFVQESSTEARFRCCGGRHLARRAMSLAEVDDQVQGLSSCKGMVRQQDLAHYSVQSYGGIVSLYVQQRPMF